MMHKNAAPKNLQSSQNSSLMTASVVGARGYAGLELVKLLLQHPQVQLTHAFATKAFKLSDDLLVEGVDDIICLSDDQILANLTDVVFLATPPEVSLKLAPAILALGKKVIDLSGAFRLKEKDYKTWYHFEHDEKELLSQADYGLLPFAGPLKPGTKLISNPGCYASAIALALIPLLREGLIDVGSLVIDAKSGTTGAGRKALENLIFSEVDEDCKPYRVGRHQHLPEIQETVKAFAGVEIDPHFSTHLLSVKRGITAAIYARATTTDIAQIEAAYAKAYGDYPLVRFGRDVNKLAPLNKVVGTPYTNICFELVNDKLYVFSTIDNLLKGAASQAVENLNRFLDLPCAHSLIRARKVDLHQQGK